MTSVQRIRDIIIGLLTMAMSVFMFLYPDTGFNVIGLIVSVALLYMGVKSILYYLRMARHMVGGLNSLYRGVILLDFAIFTWSLNEISSVYIVLYLLGIHAFTGAVDILNAFEAKGLGNPAWKFKLVYGLLNVAMAVTAVVLGIFRHNQQAVVYIYSAGLLLSGMLRIGNAFRRTAIVYIQ